MVRVWAESGTPWSRRREKLWISSGKANGIALIAFCLISQLAIKSDRKQKQSTYKQCEILDIWRKERWQAMRLPWRLRWQREDGSSLPPEMAWA